MSTNNNNTGSYNIGSYNSGSEFLVIVEIALQLAFEAGKWEGQVELEEHMERNSYFDAFLSHLYSAKTGGGVAHSVSIDTEMNTRPVKYNLRSDKWREGVRKSAKEYVEKALAMVVTHYR